jgi:hypothetical protein
MTVRVDIGKGRMTPLDDAIPHRGVVDIPFTDVEELDPPIPERVAMLRMAPVGDVIDGVGVRLDDDTFIVQECSR